jgi:hypothetical protein
MTHEKWVDVVLQEIVGPVEVSVHLVDGIVSPHMIALVAGRDLSKGDIGVVREKVHRLDTHKLRTRCRSRRVWFLFDLASGHVGNGHEVEDVTEVKGLKTLQKDLDGAVDTGEGRQLLGIVDSSRKGDKLDAIG